jgi:hypothetical protein
MSSFESRLRKLERVLFPVGDSLPIDMDVVRQQLEADCLAGWYPREPMAPQAPTRNAERDATVAAMVGDYNVWVTLGRQLQEAAAGQVSDIDQGPADAS